MKTLNTIQTLSKIAKIICKIVFILCLVGGIGCLVGILSLAFIPEGFKIGGVTVNSMIESSADVTMGAAYTGMAVGVILCAGEAVLCKFAERYFKNELAAGTPFTFDGAKELMRLGILTISISIGTTVVAAIVNEIMNHFLEGVDKIELSNGFSIGIGIAFIIMSLLCRHGAEVKQGETA